MNNQKRIAIIGATSSIAEHCAKQWAQEEGIHLVLVGRNMSKLVRVAADLKVRRPTLEIELVEADFIKPKAIQKTVNDLFLGGPITTALIAHGTLPDQADCQSNLELCQSTLEVNGVSPALFAEAFAQHMSKLNAGSIAIIGSVAGDRGRRSNYVYGAAKGLVTRYAQGLQHRFAGSGVQVTLIKPGPTDTPMTAGMDGKGKFASPEDVAKTIIAGIEKKKSVIYAPGKWQVIMMVVRHLPSFIFNKMNI
ncbi:SDR family NAD(P)-dependent oxidoreductase [Polynucleobacter paneuropaeus]|nr:SDR family NAD(P)-dependent oxidoreductase [Polynucleobacter paneuropaeus]